MKEFDQNHHKLKTHPEMPYALQAGNGTRAEKCHKKKMQLMKLTTNDHTSRKRPMHSTLQPTPSAKSKSIESAGFLHF